MRAPALAEPGRAVRGYARAHAVIVLGDVAVSGCWRCWPAARRPDPGRLGGDRRRRPASRWPPCSPSSDTLLARRTELVERTAAGGSPATSPASIVASEVVYAAGHRGGQRAGITVDTQPRSTPRSPPTRQGGSARRRPPKAARERAYAEIVIAELARRELDRAGRPAGRPVVAGPRPRPSELAQARRQGRSRPTRSSRSSGSHGVLAKAAEVRGRRPAGGDRRCWFGTPAGRVLAFQPDPRQGTWVVVRVTERRHRAGADEARRWPPRLDPASLQLIGERLLQPLADELGVRVNPRYGVWDPLAMRVVPEDEATGTILVDHARPAWLRTRKIIAPGLRHRDGSRHRAAAHAGAPGIRCDGPGQVDRRRAVTAAGCGAARRRRAGAAGRARRCSPTRPFRTTCDAPSVRAGRCGTGGAGDVLLTTDPRIAAAGAGAR